MNLDKEIAWLIEEKYQGKLTPQAKRDIQKLKNGYPLAYLIGNQPFLNTTIDLTEHPLIPRPETEYWTDLLIKSLKQQKKSLYCLDIFAGSGCIGIALLKNLPQVKVDFAEENKQFVQQIKINLQLNHISPNRYHIFQSNIFQDISSRYNLILANPPYVSLNRKHLVQKEVIQFEPSEAVFASDNGMFFIKRFLSQLPQHLLPSGKAYLEFDSWQKELIQKFVQEQNIFIIHFFQDQYQQWRYGVIEYSTKGSR